MRQVYSCLALRAVTYGGIELGAMVLNPNRRGDRFWNEGQMLQSMLDQNGRQAVREEDKVLMASVL